MEVSVSSHYMNKNAVYKKMLEGKLIYTREALLPNSSDWHLAEHLVGVPDLLPTQGNNALSAGKDNETSNTKQEKENIFGMAQRISHEYALQQEIECARKETNTNPTEGQKETGNYKKGHLKVDGLDITLENPKGSMRSGKDSNGKEWSIKMNYDYDYGYIRGTKGTDGDHIDVYLSDNPTAGNVYVIDQINQQTNAFDEHKVMYGFSSMESAREAYASQYEKGWKIDPISEISREDFKKWIDSSKRKTKPFAKYKSVDSCIETIKRLQSEDNKKTHLAELTELHTAERTELLKTSPRSVEDYSKERARENASGYFEQPKEEEDTRFRIGDGQVKISNSVHQVHSANDEKLAVTNLPASTKIPIVNVASDNISIEDATQTVDRLPDKAKTLDGVQLHISRTTRNKLKNEIAKHKEDKAILAAICNLIETVSNSVLVEEHRDRKKVNGERKADNPSDDNIDKTQHFYGAVSFDGVPYRVKSTIVVSNNAHHRMHNHEITQIELLSPIASTRHEAYTAVDSNSISLAKLFKDIEFSYEKGRKVLDENGESEVFYHNKEKQQAFHEEKLEAINEQFYEALQKQIDEILPKGYVYNLGIPNDILHSSSIPNLPIELVASRLSDKAMQENHPFDLGEV